LFVVAFDFVALLLSSGSGWRFSGFHAAKRGYQSRSGEREPGEHRHPFFRTPYVSGRSRALTQTLPFVIHHLARGFYSRNSRRLRSGAGFTKRLFILQRVVRHAVVDILDRPLDVLEVVAYGLHEVGIVLHLQVFSWRRRVEIPPRHGDDRHAEKPDADGFGESHFFSTLAARDAFNFSFSRIAACAFFMIASFMSPDAMS